MKILFLDDNKYRHQRMKQNSIGFSVSYAFDAQEAISFMKDQEFNLIMLDHDLDMSTQNEINDSEEDGRFVCRWMAEDERHKESTIIIHSLNRIGAVEMEYILRDGGFLNVFQIPCAWTRIRKTDEGNVEFDTDKPLGLEDYETG